MPSLFPPQAPRVQVILLLVFTLPVIAWLSIYRNLRAKTKFPGLIGQIFFSLSVCGSLTAPDNTLATFPAMLALYCCFSSVIVFFVSTLIAPVPAGASLRASWEGLGWAGGRVCV